ncbi:MAG: class I SAM-dependent methyltransferase [Desulfomonilaceae bacterium]
MSDNQKAKPPGAGRSSFDLIDAEKLFHEIEISPAMTFLDLGCGVGTYSIAVSGRLGREGLVYAIDLWEEGIAILRDRIAKEGYTNIKTRIADIGAAIPLEDRSVDVCLVATVLHDLVESGVQEGTLREASRVIKPQGKLIIVEFKKIDGPPGPPKSIRLSPQEVDKLVVPHGFSVKSFAELGPYHYMSIFQLNLS